MRGWKRKTPETVTTIFMNGDSIVEVGFSEWTVISKRRVVIIGLAAEASFTLPSAIDRIMLETSVGCVETPHVNTTGRIDFTIDGVGKKPVLDWCRREATSSTLVESEVSL